MELSYLEQPWNPCSRCTVTAKITTEHSMSSYGKPAIMREDGEELSVAAWALCGYQVVRATAEERQQLARMGLWRED